MTRLPELLAKPQLAYRQEDGRLIVLMVVDGRDYLTIVDDSGVLGGPVASVIVSTHNKNRIDATRKAIRENRVTYVGEEGRQRWGKVPTRTGETPTADERDVTEIDQRRNRPILSAKRRLDQSQENDTDFPGVDSRFST
jgi:hypothetical protein